jgi:CBS domain-containing protein
MRIQDVMTTPVITVEAEATLSHAMAVMARARIRHLPVVHGSALLGLLTASDLRRTV